MEPKCDQVSADDNSLHSRQHKLHSPGRGGRAGFEPMGLRIRPRGPAQGPKPGPGLRHLHDPIHNVPLLPGLRHGAHPGHGETPERDVRQEVQGPGAAQLPVVLGRVRRVEGRAVHARADERGGGGGGVRGGRGGAAAGLGDGEADEVGV